MTRYYNTVIVFIVFESKITVLEKQYKITESTKRNVSRIFYEFVSETQLTSRTGFHSAAAPRRTS